MEELLYPKWLPALFPSHIVVIIRGLICLNSGTQFGNGWFVSYGPCFFYFFVNAGDWACCSLVLLTYTARWRNVTWQMKDKEMFSGGEDRLWKQTWGVFESWQSLSLYCEVKELKINVCQDPARWTFHQIHLFLPPRYNLRDVLKEVHPQITVHCCYKDTIFLCSRKAWTLKTLLCMSVCPHPLGYHTCTCMSTHSLGHNTSETKQISDSD